MKENGFTICIQNIAHKKTGIYLAVLWIKQCCGSASKKCECGCGYRKKS
jgi:hypothetical protein